MSEATAGERIWELLDDLGRLSIPEIAQKLSIPSSTVDTALRALKRRGHVADERMPFPQPSYWWAEGEHPNAVESEPRVSTRRARRRPVKARSTLAAAKTPIAEVIELRAFNAAAADLPTRPMTRAGCELVERPCVFASCRFNLYIDASAVGSVKVNFPDLEIEEMPADASCALDLAERGGMSLAEIGTALNMTHERARQIEEQALEKVRRSPAFRDWVGAEESPRVHLRVLPGGRGR